MRNGLTSLAWRRSVGSRAPGRELDASERQSLPLGFDAVGEALVSGTSSEAACAVVGRALAREGASLGEALSGLRATYAALGGAVPDFEATEAMAVAWSEATLEFLSDVSCEDPLTGLASLHHLRSRLDEVYREAERDGHAVRGTHALVVVDGGGVATAPLPGAAFADALRLAALSEAVRTVFPGEETIARIAPGRVAVLVRRESRHGVPVGEAAQALRTLLHDRDLTPPGSVWIEGLPAQARLVGAVLRELTG
jgi:GGDEF domain-containing protein